MKVHALKGLNGAKEVQQGNIKAVPIIQCAHIGGKEPGRRRCVRRRISKKGETERSRARTVGPGIK